MASDPLSGMGAVTAPSTSTAMTGTRVQPRPELRENREASKPMQGETLTHLDARVNNAANRPELAQAANAEDKRDSPQGVLANDKEMVDKLSEAVDKINEMLQQGRQMLTFQLDEESGRMVIRVVDAQTNEVIRQIPSEETLNFAKYVDGLIGLIFNKKA
ncbi:flagellar protein FlaG [Caldichromatium japonicum]|uniref:flagellar protein FlaG n=1 Tax=Caldichromatium japonicum TaxID=2699430 RepID=UPI001FEA7119|nr:flagellar protein FlaG [Caldichromatium japonicum]